MNDEDLDAHAEDAEDAGGYCRQVEAYLCRKNDGHLIRIAGPSFTRVCKWAERGIPLNIVFRGIDRYFERYYARGARRRPVHIDFCEHDVLDVFDEWRRAVGLPALRREAPGPADTEPSPVEADPTEAAPRANAARTGSRQPASLGSTDVDGNGLADRARVPTSLPAHLERVIVRLTTLRAGARIAPEADAVVTAVIRELDAARAPVARATGETRTALIGHLAELDAQLLEAVRRSLGDKQWRAIERDAHAELAPFKGGMTADAYERAVAVAATRLLRDRVGLPVVKFEE